MCVSECIFVFLCVRGRERLREGDRENLCIRVCMCVCAYVCACGVFACVHICMLCVCGI